MIAVRHAIAPLILPAHPHHRAACLRLWRRWGLVPTTLEVAVKYQGNFTIALVTVDGDLFVGASKRAVHDVDRPSVGAALAVQRAVDAWAMERERRGREGM